VRRPALIAAALLLGAAVLAGCNSQGVGAPLPKTQVGAPPTGPTFPVVAAFHAKGNPANGKGIFTSNCAGCHTLAAANATGTVGPNLDQLKPDYRAVTAQVTLGPNGPLKGSMPAFKSSLSTQQIADVAAFVVTSTGGTAP
jgi:mono/diheme cytochrome c family protein